MKLLDLEPRWIHLNLFVFLCPHCRQILLSCKDVVLPFSEQCEIFEVALGTYWNQRVVPTREGFAWALSDRNFGTMTVTPSLDAGASGHWHGNIVNGNIVGGSIMSEANEETDIGEVENNNINVGSAPNPVPTAVVVKDQNGDHFATVAVGDAEHVHLTIGGVLHRISHEIMEELISAYEHVRELV